MSAGSESSTSSVGELPRNEIVQGDSVEVMRDLPSDSVDLVVTSPPYYKQRDYDEEEQLGREETVQAYIEALEPVFEEAVRVVRDTGSIVFNLGDKRMDGSQMLIPQRFAVEMMDSFDVSLVNDISWVKLNPTPMQSDRYLTPSTEQFFHFSVSDDYKHDIRSYLEHLDEAKTSEKGRKRTERYGKSYYEMIETADELSEDEKEVAREALDDAIERVHDGEITGFRMKIRGVHALPFGGESGGRMTQIENQGFTIIEMQGNALKRDIIESSVETLEWNDHPAVYPEYIIRHLLRLLTDEGDVVLDPFMGSGTTGVASKKLGRDYVGIDLNEEYCENARKRITGYDD